MNSRYEITNLLSKDFAGGVYEGLDTVLNRKIACRKFFNIVANSGTANWEKEFTSFCHRLTAVQHPNIAMMFDAGIDEEGPFIISQVSEGETLAEIIAKGPASEFEVFSLAQDMCEALTMIHSINETHGALIPSSIIRKSKAGGRYLHSIVDQGIAALIPIIQRKPYNGNNPALTSPEQLAGAPPTPASDLFMLGQLCYTLAAQGHPYSQASVDEAITLHHQGDQKRIERLAPHIQQPLADWIHSLIVPDPAQRPASAAEAAKSLPACIPPRGQAHQAPPAEGTSTTPTPAPEIATVTPVFNTAVQAPPTNTLLQTSVSRPSTTNFMSAAAVASTQSEVTAPVENTPTAAPAAGHQLASANSSNKNILILVVAVVVITAIVAAFAVHKGSPITHSKNTTDKDTTDKDTQNKARTLKEPRGKNGNVQYVRVELPGYNKTLTLAEVEVLSGGKNIAIDGKAEQSSTTFSGVANRAIDGNADGSWKGESLSHTILNKINPWWEVNLGGTFDIEQVKVWNRTDEKIGERLAGFQIILLDKNRKPIFKSERMNAPRELATVSTKNKGKVTYNKGTIESITTDITQ